MAVRFDILERKMTHPHLLNNHHPLPLQGDRPSAGTTDMIFSRSHSPRELHVESLDG